MLGEEFGGRFGVAGEGGVEDGLVLFGHVTLPVSAVGGQGRPTAIDLGCVAKGAAEVDE